MLQYVFGKYFTTLLYLTFNEWEWLFNSLNVECNLQYFTSVLQGTNQGRKVIGNSYSSFVNGY